MLLKTPHRKGIEAAASRSYDNALAAFEDVMPKSEINSPNYHDFTAGYNSQSASLPN